ncbi:hypothetical protein KY284_035796 [Solanum tuberosum]|nr:hypothetical protein KY284_035796 [Solanum tuberosum]
MSHSIIPYIMHIRTTREAWSYLSNLYQSQSRARVMQLRHQLQTTTKGSSTIMDYVDKKRTISHSLALAAHPISDEELMSAILFGLDSSYGPFRSAINPQLENLTTDSLLGLLLQEEEKLAEETKSLQLQANAISRQYSNRSPITGSPNQQSCTTSQNPSSRPTITNPPRSSNRSSPRIICQICEKPNHHARNCYNRNNMDTYPPNRSSNRPQANLVTPSTNSMMSPSAIVDNSWFADSGATNHVTSDLSQLSIHTDYNGEDQLAVGNGQKLSINHIGSSKLFCATRPLHLNKILHVPSITKSLLSVSQFTKDNNVFMEFHPSCCFVKDPQGKILLRGSIDNGLYRFDGGGLPVISSSTPRAFVFSRASLQAWHERLGHPHEQLLRRLVSSFNLPVSSTKMPTVCGSCQLGKSHRLPLASSSSHSLFPFDLVYSDVWGPSPHLSINGNKYFVQFLDDFTKFVWIFFLSTKSQVLDVFKYFHKMVYTQFGKKIKTLQTDWGGEYRNVSSYAQSIGITHRLSCPHTHEQNGAPERRNRTIVEKGLTLLAHACLPYQYWEHAFSTATYLHNRTITPILSFKSPYQALYHRPSDYQLLRKFGCLCYPFLHPYNNHKIDFRSLPCVFLGYSSKHKGYLCHYPPTNRMYIARHVTFDEDKFPYPHYKTFSSCSSDNSPPSSLTSLQSISNSFPTVAASPLLHSLADSHSSSSPPTQALQVPHSSNTTSPPQNTCPLTIASSTSSSYQNAPTYFRLATSSNHPMTTRAQTNSLKPKTLTVSRHFIPVSSAMASEPKTYKQAASSPEWLCAMEAEYQALRRNCTWTLAPCPPNATF